ncbi:MAG: hypothetical protein ACFB50_01440 [Rubrobacteraceae bacterium]
MDEASNNEPLSRYGRLRIYTNRAGDVQEVARLLTSIEAAYSNLYALNFVTRYDGRRRYRYFPEYPYYEFFNQVGPLLDVEGFLLPEHRLRLSSVVIQSPGFWEFLGSLNPLSQLREYLNDRHERRKDRDYREQHEDERLRLENERRELENEKLKTANIAEQAGLLRELGYEPTEVRRLLIRHGVAPLERLDHFVDEGMLGEASIEPAEDSEASED